MEPEERLRLEKIGELLIAYSERKMHPVMTWGDSPYKGELLQIRDDFVDSLGKGGKFDLSKYGLTEEEIGKMQKACLDGFEKAEAEAQAKITTPRAMFDNDDIKRSLLIELAGDVKSLKDGYGSDDLLGPVVDLVDSGVETFSEGVYRTITRQVYANREDYIKEFGGLSQYGDEKEIYWDSEAPDILRHVILAPLRGPIWFQDGVGREIQSKIPEDAQYEIAGYLPEKVKEVFAGILDKEADIIF
jgi:hypothetical protein